MCYSGCSVIAQASANEPLLLAKVGVLPSIGLDLLPMHFLEITMTAKENKRKNKQIIFVGAIYSTVAAAARFVCPELDAHQSTVALFRVS